MNWMRILAYVTGTVDQELLARNEYLAAENRILKSQLNGRLKFSDAERAMLGEIGHRLGRQALAEVATVARPDTIFAWYRKLVAHHHSPGRAVDAADCPERDHGGMRHPARLSLSPARSEKLNSPSRFGLLLCQVALNRWCCRRAART
jgi:hypothetical protein